MKSKEPEILSRASLYKKYRISESTLQNLENRQLLKIAWYTKNGLSVCSISEEDDRVLQCAVYCPDSLGTILGVRLPFSRFLLLRLFQLPVEDLAAELATLNIWRVSVAALADFEKKIVAASPKELKPLFQKKDSDLVDLDFFNTFLTVTELNLAYENPHIVEALSFMANIAVKNIIDAVLHTKNTSYEDAAIFLKNTLDITITPSALTFYKLMFLDTVGILREDIALWHKGISPSARQELRLAIGKSLKMYAATSGLETDFSEDHVISVALEKIGDSLIRQALLSETVDDNFIETIKVFNLLTDRNERLKSFNTKDVSSLFGTLRMKLEHAPPNIIKFPELPGEQNHG